MTDASRRTGRPPIPTLVAALLLAIAVFGLVDLALDGPGTWLRTHGIVELVFIVLCVGSALYLGRSWQASDRSLGEARVELQSRQVERDAWKRRAESLLRGLGEALDAQLDDWGLTPAEKETALMLLKGFSHKEIATLSERSERTVRQHAVAVYRKSGLGGRAELSAFFLEDLLLPLESPSDDGREA